MHTILSRTMDARFLSKVANDPSVRPFVGGSGPIDLSSMLENPANVALECERGGFVGVKLDTGLYECHSLFLPEGRGAYAIEAMREGLRYLFAQTDCVEVVTKCPLGNDAALGAARVMGFYRAFDLEQGWLLEDGTRGKVSCYALPFYKWLERDPLVEEMGVWFHKRLEDLTTAAGAKIPVHYDEPSHNRAVGAAVLMFFAGQPVKATMTYNRWAALAGFPLIKLLGTAPVIIDMDQVIVALNATDMEILKCRSV